ncbi:TIGR02285 family protein [Colwellia sp. 12G3]|uniref:TIGR02285 family protein n=1 Tax=Colwellia sp. 12G3 TaxID=2058299 RepID=UPI0012FEBDAC|nr:TIGR02285 family protein [Colwellia sp. 12G3]
MKLILFVVFVFFSFLCTAKEQMTWYAYNQPPAYIFEGKFKNQGFINLTQEILIKTLTQYHHNTEQVTVGRFLHQLRLKENACVLGLYKTPEREKYILYSDNALMHRGLHVLISKKKAQHFKLTSPLDLAELLQKHNLSTIVIQGRSYGNMLDNILNKNLENVLSRSSQSNSQLYKMLALNRFDFLIDYPSTAAYAFKSKLLKSDDYVLLKINGIPSYIESSVGCSKTEWGYRAISAINIALKKEKNTKAYLDALLSWSSNLSDREDFIKFYYQEFLFPQSPKN